MSIGAAFASAATAAADALALPAVAARWAGPSALAGMTVGAVAAHLDAGIDRFEALLAAPEPTEGPVVDVGTFYGANRIEGDALATDDRLHAFLRDDATALAAVGPAAVLAAFTGRVERLLVLVPSVPPDRWVATIRVPGGRTRFDDYLATRVVELAVHTDDLLVSVGASDGPLDPVVADVVLDVGWRLARARSGDLGLLRACFRGERAGPVLPVL